MSNQKGSAYKEKVVLIGGGHAHVKLLYLMRQKGGYEEYEVTLVSKSHWQYYSGMVGGFLEGLYQEDELRFDLIELCKMSKVTFLEAEVSMIQPNESMILFSDGKSLNFDILSIDIGSEVNGLELESVREYANQIKPFHEIMRFRGELLKQTTFDDPIIFAGAGPASIELALSLKQLLAHHNLPFKLTIVNGQTPAQKGHPGKLTRKIDVILKREGIHSIMGNRVHAVKESRASLKDGTELAFRFLLWATGPKSSEVIKSSGFQTDEKGYLLVNEYLQAVNHPRIFGAGDCIGFGKNQLIKKAGVYAVREADYLYHNIKATLNNKEQKAYRPQKQYLSIISTGGRKGLLQLRGIVMEGKLCWRLKNYIDTRFMRRMKR